MNTMLHMLRPEKALPRINRGGATENGDENNENADQPVFYTIDDLMEIMDCCYNTARKMMADPDFPSFKTHERWYVQRKDLKEYWREKVEASKEEGQGIDTLDVIS